MRQQGWIRYVGIGVCATAALLGVLLLVSRLTTVSFVPLDIADAIIRLTPGAIATQGIENLGPIAKVMVELSGSAIFLAVGGLLAWLYARFAPRPPLLAGVALALVVFGLTLLAQAIAGRLSGSALTLPLTAVLYLSWGSALAWAVNRLVATRSVAAGDSEAVQAAPERRSFLFRSGGAFLAVAVGSGAIAQLLERTGAGSQVAGAGEALPGAAPTTAPAATSTATTGAASTAASAPTIAASAPTVASAPTTAAESTSPAPTAGHAVEESMPMFMAADGTRAPFNNNESLYVISSATRDPEVDRGSWKLEVGGAVNTPFELNYDDLLALPATQQISTMECISNEVGNYLIGNVKWTGVTLEGLLERAGVQDGVIDIKLTAADGYTESIPLDRAMNPNTLVAYGIDGQALGVKHGFPARLRVPGLYGEKNVKWLTKIEAVREDYQGYWQQRGWTDTAIIETTAVIDTGNPRISANPLPRENGVVPLGGIAFSGERGISKVELKIDDGEWQEAALDPESNPISWRFWRYDWQAEPGKHTLAVRATDGTGTLQTDAVRDTHPDGATGYHIIEVTVA
ncbi:MAG: molybdopterin-dependent oxidoreductase [Roseiflexaceae bacterium]|nr:molybdopterin-dependent oxidoreductase [Roseiflexaceae bacterium]